MDKNDFKLPELVVKILETLRKAGFEAYVVGGAVRDLLTGKAVTDWDFTTKAKPEEILKLFDEAFYDNRFGTVGVAVKHLNEQFGEQVEVPKDEVVEITTFRSESSYTDKRRPDKVKWGKSLEEDLKRRDFTINAMALDEDLKVIDPFHGQVDLGKKQIKAVGEAKKRFEEDGLRMMRAIRIGAELGFKIETETFAAIKDKSSLIKHIAWERIRDELLKILSSDHPKEGVMMLDGCGLLKIIVPEFLETRGVKQAGHHTKDVWLHSLDALAATPAKDPIVRMATWLHDVGKPEARKNGPKDKITFYNHEVIGARTVKKIAKRLKMSKEQIDLLWLLVRWHMFAYDPKMTDKAIRRFIKRVGLKHINKMMMLRIGDRIGGGSKATSWRLRELQERIGQVLYTPMEIKDLKVNGKDVMKVLKIKGGPKVGKVLKKLFDEVMEDSKKNEREYLLKRIKQV